MYPCFCSYSDPIINISIYPHNHGTVSFEFNSVVDIIVVAIPAY